MKPQSKRPSLDYISPNSICGEIGVWKGAFSRLILEQDPHKLHLIDPWISQYKNRWYSCPQDKLDTIFKTVESLFAGDERVIIHRKFSMDISFGDSYFDWLYIDGDHTYEVVKKELNKYYPLIKRGGFLCGHDYGPTGKETNGGPRRAVDEFIEEKDLSLLDKGHCREFVIEVI